MIELVNFEGVKAKVRKANFMFLSALVLAALALTACGPGNTGNTTGTNSVDPNEAAATVNGKVIKLEQVERLLKQQAQGQESKLSPLELAQARLQILEGLIQSEVMFQKAEKEATVPTDDEVRAEFNRMKTASGKSEEQFRKDLESANETEASLLETVKKQLSVKKLEDKITGQVTPPKDSEVDAFYNGNKAAFVKKKGAKLAAIIIDPTDAGEGDLTKNDADAARVGNEIIAQLKQDPEKFSQIASEKSEDQSRFQGGDLGYIAEEELKRMFSPQTAANIMQMQNGALTIAQAQNKFFILKVQEKSDRDEALTLDSPGVREQVIKSLTDARKQLLVQAYAAIAMNEAKIVNNLAQKVVANPNDLSGARPASADTPAANSNANANSNTAAANTNSTSNSNAANSKPAEKPAANTANSNAKK